MSTIKPFSGPHYSDNAEKAGMLTPCVICGKGVRFVSGTPLVFVIDGGAEFGDGSSDTKDPGFMGLFPVGPDCWRKHKQELAPHQFTY